MIYWGDLHNHCAITYGFGGLTNALDAAQRQLDFCSITPHAMWHDMPEKNPDTEFVVNFHEEGFAKINKNWNAVRDEVEARNKDGEFVTFHSYEMHSSLYGDYHIVSPDSEFELIYGDSPFDVIGKQCSRAVIIPHHIGYTPGYRGINWEAFDETLSPVVEVCSKHGCAVSEASPFNYYHNMGPRDPRCTAYAGLKMGKRFSFVGSTDHHAGFPGSYGDCKMAVRAGEKTREAIWRAIKDGHTYAVTGDKILCDFTVNGEVFGSKIQAGRERNIEFSVTASDFIDKLVVYKNLKPIHVICGESLNDGCGTGKYKVRLELGWGSDTTPYRWDCSLDVTGGVISDIETCFRGRSILAPTPELSADMDVNKLQTAVTERSERSAKVVCETLRNISTLHPQTSAVVFEIDGNGDTVLSFVVNGVAVSRTLRELAEAGMSGQMKPHNSESFKIHTAVPVGKYTISGAVKDFADADADGSGASGARDFYHMEVRQANSHMAYVSPVFVEMRG